MYGCPTSGQRRSYDPVERRDQSAATSGCELDSEAGVAKITTSEENYFFTIIMISYSKWQMYG